MSPRVRSVRIRNMTLSLADLPHIYIRAETCMTRSLQWHHPDYLALRLLYLIRLMSHGLLSTPEASDDLPYIYSGSLPPFDVTWVMVTSPLLTLATREMTAYGPVANVRHLVSSRL
jgi:hypothetical protein